MHDHSPPRRGTHPAALDAQPNNTRKSSVGDESKPSYDSALDERPGRDLEKHDPETAIPKKQEPGDELPWYKQRKQSSARDDPFGDEEGAEVKYRTMRWW